MDSTTAKLPTRSILSRLLPNLGSRGLFSTTTRKVRVALTPTSFLLHSRLANGVRVAGYNRSGFGGRGVYIFRDSQEPELAALSRFVEPGMCFVDVGANVGVYSMKAAKEVGSAGLVIAIEPYWESAAMLARNVEYNRFTNVRIRNFCVAQETGHTALYRNQSKPNHFGLVSSRHVDSVSVLAVRLDDLAKWEALDRLDYLKIDAEGAEAWILAGGRSTIERFRPIIQVEIDIAKCPCPPNYSRFVAQPSPNEVLIPAENARAAETARNLGWAER